MTTPPPPIPVLPSAPAIAKRFHETYERLAPSYGWTTNAATACEWERLPHANRELMTHVVNVVVTEALEADRLTLRTALEEAARLIRVLLRLRHPEDCVCVDHENAADWLTRHDTTKGTR